MLLSSISKSCARSFGMRRYLLPLILVGVNCIGIFLPTRRLDRTKHRQYHNRGVTLAAVWSSQEARWSGVGWDGYVSGDLDRPGRWKRFRASGWNLFSGKFGSTVPRRAVS